MAGVAKLAQELGHEVSGSDKNTYPPMDKQLHDLGIEITDSQKEEIPPPDAELVIIGNGMTRGTPIVEFILAEKINYCSGPDWIQKNILCNKKNIVVTGTHGKTTVASLIAWLLNDNGIDAGFLIGGIPKNFGFSAKIGKSNYFVIEGDEYDTCFFDKRSKFIHYNPEILVINNIEYDHSDIFKNLDEIIKQFHFLLRTMSERTNVIIPDNDKNISRLINQGCWSQIKKFSGLKGADIQFEYRSSESCLKVMPLNKEPVTGRIPLLGKHNSANVTAAILACQTAGLDVERSLASLASFQNVSRRLELVGTFNDIKIYNDFAHHPTAIVKTIEAISSRIGTDNRLFVVIEPSSNTMQSGIHKKALKNAFKYECIFLLYDQASLNWTKTFAQNSEKFLGYFNQSNEAAEILTSKVSKGDSILIMSNGKIQKLINAIIEQIKQKKENKI